MLRNTFLKKLKSFLSNHFHLLVEVPQRPASLPDDGELLRRLALVSRKSVVIGTRQLLEARAAENNPAMLAAVLQADVGYQHVHVAAQTTFHPLVAERKLREREFAFAVRTR